MAFAVATDVKGFHEKQCGLMDEDMLSVFATHFVWM